MSDVREDAVTWLAHEADALTGCIERLAGIDNPAVDTQRRDLEVQRLCKQRERWRYLLRLVQADAEPRP